MANQMSLPPELYNLLVFGESDDASPEEAAMFALGLGTSTCALPPADSSPPPEGSLCRVGRIFRDRGSGILRKNGIKKSRHCREIHSLAD